MINRGNNSNFLSKDVTALYNNSGSLVAQYEYDAWGNTLSVTDASGNEITAWYNIANANPIRYRGVEQIEMLHHHTINTANKMNNQINRISPFNRKLGGESDGNMGP